jgi:site-specific recombinase XerD
MTTHPDPFTEQVETFSRNCNSARTRARYRAALLEFGRWYGQSNGFATTDAANLTDHDAREWRSHLVTTRRLSAAAVNLRLAALRGLARSHGLALRVQNVRRVTPPLDPLEVRAINRLIAAIEGDDWPARRDRAMLSLLARAGLRVSELVALRPADLTLSYRKGQLVVRHGKGLKERTLPITKQARVELLAYLAVRPEFGGETLFVSRRGGPLDSRDVQRLVSKAARLAGITQPVTPHLLRHSFATRALRQGEVDLATLSQLLGHTNLATTARYLHPDQAQVAAMIEEL